MLPYFRQLFFYIWYKKYQQIMGIPMESDPVPFMANLFLSHYEDKWIRLKKKEKRKGLIIAEKIASVFRIIDGLTALSDGGKFEKALHEICRPELELKVQNR